MSDTTANIPPKTFSAGGFVLNPRMQLLMVQEFGEYWGVPRGHIDEGEEAIDAARREIKEESGIENLALLGLIGSYTRSTFDHDGKPNNKEIKHITMFCFKTSELNLIPRDPDITDVAWLELDDAEKKLISPDDIMFFKQAKFKIKEYIKFQ